MARIYEPTQEEIAEACRQIREERERGRQAEADAAAAETDDDDV